MYNTFEIQLNIKQFFEYSIKMMECYRLIFQSCLILCGKNYRNFYELYVNAAAFYNIHNIASLHLNFQH